MPFKLDQSGAVVPRCDVSLDTVENSLDTTPVDDFLSHCWLERRSGP
jgi:hypothetical protein